MGDFEYLPYEEQEQSQLSESEIEPTPSGSLSDIKDITGRGTRLLRLGVIGAALIVGVIVGLVFGLLLDRENSEIQATNPTNHSVSRASTSSTLPPIDLELLPIEPKRLGPEGLHSSSATITTPTSDRNPTGPERPSLLVDPPPTLLVDPSDSLSSFMPGPNRRFPPTTTTLPTTSVPLQFGNRNAAPLLDGYPSWGWCTFDRFNIVCAEGWEVLPDDGWENHPQTARPGNWFYGIWLKISAISPEGSTVPYSLVQAYSPNGVELLRVVHGYQDQWCQPTVPGSALSCMLVFEGSERLDEIHLSLPFGLNDRRVFRLPIEFDSEFWLRVQVS